ncbi:MAG: hypothetical protein VW378_05570 [bacterium]
MDGIDNRVKRKKNPIANSGKKAIVNNGLFAAAVGETVEEISKKRKDKQRMSETISKRGANRPLIQEPEPNHIEWESKDGGDAAAGLEEEFPNAQKRRKNYSDEVKKALVETKNAILETTTYTSLTKAIEEAETEEEISKETSEKIKKEIQAALSHTKTEQKTTKDKKELKLLATATEALELAEQKIEQAEKEERVQKHKDVQKIEKAATGIQAEVRGRNVREERQKAVAKQEAPHSPLEKSKAKAAKLFSKKTKEEQEVLFKQNLEQELRAILAENCDAIQIDRTPLFNKQTCINLEKIHDYIEDSSIIRKKTSKHKIDTLLARLEKEGGVYKEEESYKIIAAHQFFSDIENTLGPKESRVMLAAFGFDNRESKGANAMLRKAIIAQAESCEIAATGNAMLDDIEKLERRLTTKYELFEGMKAKWKSFRNKSVFSTLVSDNYRNFGMIPASGHQAAKIVFQYKQGNKWETCVIPVDVSRAGVKEVTETNKEGEISLSDYLETHEDLKKLQINSDKERQSLVEKLLYLATTQAEDPREYEEIKLKFLAQDESKTSNVRAASALGASATAISSLLPEEVKEEIEKQVKESLQDIKEGLESATEEGKEMAQKIATDLLKSVGNAGMKTVLNLLTGGLARVGIELAELTAFISGLPTIEEIDIDLGDLTELPDLSGLAGFIEGLGLLDFDIDTLQDMDLPDLRNLLNRIFLEKGAEGLKALLDEIQHIFSESPTMKDLSEKIDEILKSIEDRLDDIEQSLEDIDSEAIKQQLLEPIKQKLEQLADNMDSVLKAGTTIAITASVLEKKFKKEAGSLEQEVFFTDEQEKSTSSQILVQETSEGRLKFGVEFKIKKKNPRLKAATGYVFLPEESPKNQEEQRRLIQTLKAMPRPIQDLYCHCFDCKELSESVAEEDLVENIKKYADFMCHVQNIVAKKNEIDQQNCFFSPGVEKITDLIAQVGSTSKLQTTMKELGVTNHHVSEVTERTPSILEGLESLKDTVLALTDAQVSVLIASLFVDEYHSQHDQWIQMLSTHFVVNQTFLQKVTAETMQVYIQQALQKRTDLLDKFSIDTKTIKQVSKRLTAAYEQELEQEHQRDGEQLISEWPASMFLQTDAKDKAKINLPLTEMLEIMHQKEPGIHRSKMLDVIAMHTGQKPQEVKQACEQEKKALLNELKEIKGQLEAPKTLSARAIRCLRETSDEKTLDIIKKSLRISKKLHNLEKLVPSKGKTKNEGEFPFENMAEKLAQIEITKLSAFLVTWTEDPSLDQETVEKLMQKRLEDCRYKTPTDYKQLNEILKAQFNEDMEPNRAVESFKGIMQLTQTQTNISAETVTEKIQKAAKKNVKPQEGKTSEVAIRESLESWHSTDKPLDKFCYALGLSLSYSQEEFQEKAEKIKEDIGSKKVQWLWSNDTFSFSITRCRSILLDPNRSIDDLASILLFLPKEKRTEFLARVEWLNSGDPSLEEKWELAQRLCDLSEEMNEIQTQMCGDHKIEAELQVRLSKANKMLIKLEEEFKENWIARAFGRKNPGPDMLHAIKRMNTNIRKQVTVQTEARTLVAQTEKEIAQEAIKTISHVSIKAAEKVNQDRVLYQAVYANKEDCVKTSFWKVRENKHRVSTETLNKILNQFKDDPCVRFSAQLDIPKNQLRDSPRFRFRRNRLKEAELINFQYFLQEKGLAEIEEKGSHVMITLNDLSQLETIIAEFARQKTSLSTRQQRYLFEQLSKKFECKVVNTEEFSKKIEQIARVEGLSEKQENRLLKLCGFKLEGRDIQGAIAGVCLQNKSILQQGIVMMKVLASKREDIKRTGLASTLKSNNMVFSTWDFKNLKLTESADPSSEGGTVTFQYRKPDSLREEMKQTYALQFVPSATGKREIKTSVLTVNPVKKFFAAALGKVVPEMIYKRPHLSKKMLKKLIEESQHTEELEDCLKYNESEELLEVDNSVSEQADTFLEFIDKFCKANKVRNSQKTLLLRTMGFSEWQHCSFKIPVSESEADMPDAIQGLERYYNQLSRDGEDIKLPPNLEDQKIFDGQAFMRIVAREASFETAGLPKQKVKFQKSDDLVNFKTAFAAQIAATMAKNMMAQADIDALQKEMMGQLETIQDAMQEYLDAIKTGLIENILKAKNALHNKISAIMKKVGKTFGKITLGTLSDIFTLGLAEFGIDIVLDIADFVSDLPNFDPIPDINWPDLGIDIDMPHVDLGIEIPDVEFGTIMDLPRLRMALHIKANMPDPTELRRFIENLLEKVPNIDPKLKEYLNKIKNKLEKQCQHVQDELEHITNEVGEVVELPKIVMNKVTDGIDQLQKELRPPAFTLPWAMLTYAEVKEKLKRIETALPAAIVSLLGDNSAQEEHELSEQRHNFLTEKDILPLFKKLSYEQLVGMATDKQESELSVLRSEACSKLFAQLASLERGGMGILDASNGICSRRLTDSQKTQLYTLGLSKKMVSDLETILDKKSERLSNYKKITFSGKDEIIIGQRSDGSQRIGVTIREKKAWIPNKLIGNNLKKRQFGTFLSSWKFTVKSIGLLATATSIGLTVGAPMIVPTAGIGCLSVFGLAIIKGILSRNTDHSGKEGTTLTGVRRGAIYLPDASDTQSQKEDIMAKMVFFPTIHQKLFSQFVGKESIKSLMQDSEMRGMLEKIGLIEDGEFQEEAFIAFLEKVKDDRGMATKVVDTFRDTSDRQKATRDLREDMLKAIIEHSDFSKNYSVFYATVINQSVDRYCKDQSNQPVINTDVVKAAKQFAGVSSQRAKKIGIGQIVKKTEGIKVQDKRELGLDRQIAILAKEIKEGQEPAQIDASDCIQHCLAAKATDAVISDVATIAALQLAQKETHRMSSMEYQSMYKSALRQQIEASFTEQLREQLGEQLEEMIAPANHSSMTKEDQRYVQHFMDEYNHLVQELKSGSLEEKIEKQNKLITFLTRRVTPNMRKKMGIPEEINTIICRQERVESHLQWNTHATLRLKGEARQQSEREKKEMADHLEKVLAQKVTQRQAFDIDPDKLTQRAQKVSKLKREISELEKDKAGLRKKDDQESKLEQHKLRLRRKKQDLKNTEAELSILTQCLGEEIDVDTNVDIRLESIIDRLNAYNHLQQQAVFTNLKDCSPSEEEKIKEIRDKFVEGRSMIAAEFDYLITHHILPSELRTILQQRYKMQVEDELRKLTEIVYEQSLGALRIDEDKFKTLVGATHTALQERSEAEFKSKDYNQATVLRREYSEFLKELKEEVPPCKTPLELVQKANGRQRKQIHFQKVHRQDKQRLLAELYEKDQEALIQELLTMKINAELFLNKDFWTNKDQKQWFGKTTKGASKKLMKAIQQKAIIDDITLFLGQEQDANALEMDGIVRPLQAGAHSNTMAHIIDKCAKSYVEKPRSERKTIEQVFDPVLNAQVSVLRGKLAEIRPRQKGSEKHQKLAKTLIDYGIVSGQLTSQNSQTWGVITLEGEQKHLFASKDSELEIQIEGVSVRDYIIAQEEKIRESKTTLERYNHLFPETLSEDVLQLEQDLEELRTVDPFDAESLAFSTKLKDIIITMNTLSKQSLVDRLRGKPELDRQVLALLKTSRDMGYEGIIEALKIELAEMGINDIEAFIADPTKTLSEQLAELFDFAFDQANIGLSKAFEPFADDTAIIGLQKDLEEKIGQVTQVTQQYKHSFTVESQQQLDADISDLRQSIDQVKSEMMKKVSACLTSVGMEEDAIEELVRVSRDQGRLSSIDEVIDVCQATLADNEEKETLIRTLETCKELLKQTAIKVHDMGYSKMTVDATEIHQSLVSRMNAEIIEQSQKGKGLKTTAKADQRHKAAAAAAAELGLDTPIQVLQQTAGNLKEQGLADLQAANDAFRELLITLNITYNHQQQRFVQTQKQTTDFAEFRRLTDRLKDLLDHLEQEGKIRAPFGREYVDFIDKIKEALIVPSEQAKELSRISVQNTVLEEQDIRPQQDIFTLVQFDQTMDHLRKLPKHSDKAFQAFANTCLDYIHPAIYLQNIDPESLQKTQQGMSEILTKLILEEPLSIESRQWLNTLKLSNAKDFATYCDRLLATTGINILMSFKDCYHFIAGQQTIERKKECAGKLETFFNTHAEFEDMYSGSFKKIFISDSGDKYLAALQDLHAHVSPELHDPPELKEAKAHLQQCMALLTDSRTGKIQDSVHRTELYHMFNRLAWIKYKSSKPERIKMIDTCLSLLRSIALSPENTALREQFESHLTTVFTKQFLGEEREIFKEHVHADNLPEHFLRDIQALPENKQLFERLWQTLPTENVALPEEKIAQIDQRELAKINKIESVFSRIAGMQKQEFKVLNKVGETYHCVYKGQQIDFTLEDPKNIFIDHGNRYLTLTGQWNDFDTLAGQRTDANMVSPLFTMPGQADQKILKELHDTFTAACDVATYEELYIEMNPDPEKIAAYRAHKLKATEEPLRAQIPSIVQAANSFEDGKSALVELDCSASMTLPHYVGYDQQFDYLTPSASLALLKECPELWQHPEQIIDKKYKPIRDSNPVYKKMKEIKAAHALEQNTNELFAEKFQHFVNELKKQQFTKLCTDQCPEEYEDVEAFKTALTTMFQGEDAVDYEEIMATYDLFIQRKPKELSTAEFFIELQDILNKRQPYLRIKDLEEYQTMLDIYETEELGKPKKFMKEFYQNIRQVTGRQNGMVTHSDMNKYHKIMAINELERIGQQIVTIDSSRKKLKEFSYKSQKNPYTKLKNDLETLFSTKGRTEKVKAGQHFVQKAKRYGISMEGAGQIIRKLEELGVSV